jgi:hypothetical protein
VLLRVYSRWIEEAMPAPPELPSFTSDEQPAAARTHAAASQAQVGHDARAEAISGNV